MPKAKKSTIEPNLENTSPTAESKSNSGVDEMNLAVLPITRLSRQDERTTIEFIGTYTDDRGHQYKTKWLVQAGPDGLPGEIGNDVLITLLTQGYEDGSLTDRAGLQRQYFTPYQLLQALGLSDGIENYKLIEMTVKQLHQITITSENLWIDTLPNGKIRQRRSTRGMHIISNFYIYRENHKEEDKPVDAIPGLSFVTWDDMFLHSLRSGYIKQLNLTLYFALTSPLAKRLYRFIDKMTALAPEKPYEIDIFDLANRLGMQPHDKANQLRRNLKRALEELIEKKYLYSFEFIKVGKYSRVRILRPEAYTMTPPSPAQLPLTAALQAEVAAPTPPLGPEEILWAAALAELPATIVEHLQGVHLVSITAGVATLSPTRKQDWLQNRSQAKILRALRAAGAEVESLAFLPLSA